MEWDESLLTDQKEAAIHVGTHARLLAGPGTGKTHVLTHRILFLVSQKNVPPEHIMAITFTRAAAHELLERVTDALNGDKALHISTLHSFALRQILRNSSKIRALPRPFRIADDWEEHHIVLEDLKAMLGLQRIDEARELLNRLSADWQSLTADEEDREERFPDPRFLGVWQEHRKIYGYTLRAELVYQLKKALEQPGDFEFESPIKFLIVDEYQDLNRCDLAVIKSIVSRGVELFAAGDDDQSIYGFRKAHPAGIRRFKDYYPDAADLELATCMRCDRRILELGLFVARQDFRRIEKNIQAKPDCNEGKVEILGFNNQNEEAQGIADLCTYLMTQEGLSPDDILILLRSDRRGILSAPILEKFRGTGIRVVPGTNTGGVLDNNAGRVFLSFLRLSVTAEDSLAWRSVLKIWCDGIGPGSINTIYDLARRHEKSFAQTVAAAHANKGILPERYRSRLSRAISKVFRQLEALFPRDNSGVYETHDQLMDVVRSTARSIVQDEEERDSIQCRVDQAAGASESTSMEKLIQVLVLGTENIEQRFEEDSINILTMHQAKGLTAEAVIVAAAEDQYIPGNSTIDDERRLLYVSLTRAKHYLYITYCGKRTGQQRHTGNSSGSLYRSLTQFLSDCPHTPRNGRGFIDCLTGEKS